MSSDGGLDRYCLGSRYVGHGGAEAAVEAAVGWTVPKRESRGLRPGVLIYVILTAGAVVGSTRALRRRATLSTPELYRLSLSLLENILGFLTERPIRLQ